MGCLIRVSSSIMQPLMGPGGRHLNPHAGHAAATTTGRETEGAERSLSHGLMEETMATRR